MLLKQVFLGVIGLCAGGVIAAGIYAFLAIIGIFPRLIGKTKTRNHILLYETVMMAGGFLGNLMDLYEVPVRLGGSLFLGICRLSCHVFSRNLKGTSGAGQKDPSGGRASLYHSGDRHWKDDRFPGVFFLWNGEVV